MGAIRKAGVVLLVLNEIRGVIVVLSILGAWAHADRPAAAALAARPPAPTQPSGSSGAIIRPQ